jgi:2-polyprenyl-6-methoxyphenol hydroxylase-like FAD-dependent oxidoreductase
MAFIWLGAADVDKHSYLSIQCIYKYIVSEAHMAMEADSTSVLVVGGGLAGLSAAVFLALREVPVVLVERHAGSSPHPRAIGFTPRTMELYRAAGLGQQIPQVPKGSSGRPGRVKAASLAGEHFEETPWTPEAPRPVGIEHSPCSGAAIAQDRLELILRARADELGVDVRLETELTHFEQSASGVVATLRGRDASAYTLRADYLIAADGHSSGVREALGIGRDGRGHIQTVRSVLFRAPLDQYLEGGVSQFDIEQPGLKAFLTTYRDGRWVLMFSDDEERDEATLIATVKKAIGRPDLDIEIITTGRWELSALIANKFSSGRVFLAGDSAHTLPPARGGYGANTGIEDAHNLSWKLASVLSGASAPELLDTYDAERRPIAWLRHRQIFARPDYKAVADARAVEVPIIDDDAMELGQLYRSAAVLGAGAELPPALRPEQWKGQPGTRAPHMWVIKDSEQMSTLDLFGNGWLLLAEDEHWSLAAARAAERLEVSVKWLRIGTDATPSSAEAFRAAFGIGPAGASLVRPDGYIAWRSTDLPADAVQTLIVALGSVAHPASLSVQPAQTFAQTQG